MVVVSPWVSNLALSFEDPFILHFWNEISGYCTIILYDRHGCGLSDRDRIKFDTESELTDLKNVVRHLGLDKLILFGNSMAGPISINYTVQHPNKVSHLVLYDTYANGKKLAYGIPNSRLKALNGNIHFPFYEEPEVIIGEIKNFLSIDGTIADVDHFKGGKSKNTNEPSKKHKKGEGYKRQLAAILSADVKGYSRLMGDDEIQTIQTLKKYRQSMSNAIKHYNGRIVDNPGDNLLAEFISAVDAVECAQMIQATLKEKNKDLPVERRLEFRIGINIGDVIHDGDRIYGHF
jgi:hypothetical protein